MAKQTKPTEIKEEKKSQEVSTTNRAHSGEKSLSEYISTLIALGVILGLPYYLIVWRNTQSPFRWILPLAALLIFGIFYLRNKAKTTAFVRYFINVLIVINLIFGAIFFAVIFSKHELNWFLKLFTVLYFSLLPPWLYLQFITTKGKTLWDEYVDNLFRLRIDKSSNLPEPNRKSKYYEEWVAEGGKIAHPDRSDPELLTNSEKSIYEKKFEGLFGQLPSATGKSFVVFRGENLWPVAFATLLISVGWIIVMQPESFWNVIFLNKHISILETHNLSYDAFRFGFIGSFFYIMQMLVRRYFQNDLKTNAYVNSIMRIVIVMLLVWVLAMIWPPTVDKKQLSLIAFIIGVFPQVGWQVLVMAIKIPFKIVVPSLRSNFPLSDIDGLNVWYESRLLEEGIEDLQNLVTANLVDLMLNTRIPIERLVDWIDQAILFLHVGINKKKTHLVKREKLKIHGIRTATDLLDAFDLENLKQFPETQPPLEHIKKLDYLLNESAENVSIMRVILSTLQNEPNLYHVLQWKCSQNEVHPVKKK